MEKEDIKYITGEIHFLELVEKKSSSLVFKGPSDEEISCNESDVESLDDYEVGEEYSMFVVKVEEDRVGLDIGFSREIPLLGEDLPKLKSVWPKEGDELFITLRRDFSGQLFARLATETIISSLYSKAPKSLKNKDIEAYPYRLMRVGTFLLSKDGYKIFVHESEREREPRLGEKVTLRVIGVKDNGEVNGSFLPRAHERMDSDGQAIMDYIENNGYCEFTDKSSPEDIKAVFGMSKGSFKRAVGRLFKNKLIMIEEDGLYKRKGR